MYILSVMFKTIVTRQRSSKSFPEATKEIYWQCATRRGGKRRKLTTSAAVIIQPRTMIVGSEKSNYYLFRREAWGAGKIVK